MEPYYHPSHSLYGVVFKRRNNFTSTLTFIFTAVRTGRTAPYWRITANLRIRSQANPCGIRGGERETRTDFAHIFWFDAVSALQQSLTLFHLLRTLCNVRNLSVGTDDVLGAIRSLLRAFNPPSGVSWQPTVRREPLLFVRHFQY